MPKRAVVEILCVAMASSSLSCMTAAIGDNAASDASPAPTPDADPPPSPPDAGARPPDGGDHAPDADVQPTGDLTLPLRGAFYYPWYPQTWTVGGEHVFYEPELGYYDSDSAEVVDRHIDDLTYAKVEVAIASWWGVDAQNEDVRIPLLLERTLAAGGGLRWALYYEKEGFDRFDTSVAALRADLAYLQRYASSAAFARIAGKPVIFVYNANDGDCSVADRWADAAGDDWYVVLKVFAGYRSCTRQPSSWHQYGPSTAAQEHDGASYSISPGFWRADRDAPDLARDPARWRQNVSDMVASGQPWQLIVTFNEWGEGTAVEPAHDWASASGNGVYLDTLHTDGAAP
jgi:hypothetical protein